MATEPPGVVRLQQSVGQSVLRGYPRRPSGLVPQSRRPRRPIDLVDVTRAGARTARSFAHSEAELSSYTDFLSLLLGAAIALSKLQVPSETLNVRELGFCQLRPNLDPAVPGEL